MVSNINILPLRTWQAIPTTWEARPNTINYHQLPEEEHFADGFRDYIRPVSGIDYDPDIQRLGELYHDLGNDVVTNYVVDIPIEELQQRIISQRQAEGEEIRQRKLKDDTISFFQTVPAEDALQNQAVFPFWEPDLPFVEATHRYQHWLGMEMVLWEVIQPHAPSFYNFPPAELPALWKRVALPDEILPWVQPLGSFDAYQTGDRVSHVQNSVNKLWESTHDNNTWMPGVFGWTDLGAYP